MVLFDLNNLVRENVKRLIPYSSARDDFAGTADIYLDANENSFGSPLGMNYTRYPDPYQRELKLKIAEIKSVQPNQIFIGNGSDEAIDLLIRIFCQPGIDSILVCPPTYGMYEIAAQINDVAVKEIELTKGFQPDFLSINEHLDGNTKIVFFCSPNNPTGNSMDRDEIVRFASSFSGIVVVDEAYADFAKQNSFAEEISKLPNLVILQTFSKAWGLAGLRVGMAIATTSIIALLNRIKPPYNVNETSQKLVLDALDKSKLFDENIVKIKEQREFLAKELNQLNSVWKVFPSDANFLLVEVGNANEIYAHLINENIVVRNRDSLRSCKGCLRITVGTKAENVALLQALKKYEETFVY